MSKVYDLSSYLQEEKAKIKLGEEEFEINDGFNDMLKVDALSNRQNDMSITEFVVEFLKITLGEDVAKVLLERNYKSKVYLKIMEKIQEAYSDNPDDNGESSSPTLV